jgi:3-hydroxyisobutyrate dehydrogenase-like beta-hydroxyacid dehydrogenase
LEAIQAGTGRNTSIDMIMPNNVLPRSFDLGAAISILEKDVDLALAEGEMQGGPQFVCQQVRQIYKLAIHKGWADRDVTEIVKMIEEWSGTEIAKQL